MRNPDERNSMVVLRHAGWSYVRCDYGSAVYMRTPGDRSTETGLFINGRSALTYPICRGDENYREIKGDVKSVQIISRPRSVVVSYVARPEFAESLKAPLSVLEYEALPEERRELLYQPVTRQELVAPVDFAFEVIDLDAKPRAFPPGVLVTVPDYLRRYRTNWHGLPCEMSGAAVFKRIVEAVKAEVKDKPHFSLTHYENICTLTVSTSIVLANFPAQKISFDIISLRGDRDRAPVPAITGSNLDDLMENVDACVAKYVKALSNIHSPTVCPCCARKLTKDTPRVVLPAPRR